MRIAAMLLCLLTACATKPTPTPMPNSKGISLHIGMNGVDPDEYGGWPGTLPDCEMDANLMAEIATGNGFKVTKLLTQSATADAVLGFIAGAAQVLKVGDTFLLTYSGHGGQVSDYSGEETDGKDETWLLWDRQLTDDELLALSAFRPGVQVVVISDSCHSGTLSRERPRMNYVSRRAPQSACNANLAKHKAKFQQAKAVHKANKLRKVRFSGTRGGDFPEKPVELKPLKDAMPQGPFSIFFGGCQDNQESQSTGKGGAFTLALAESLGASSTYRDLYNRTVRLLPATQIPSMDSTSAGPITDKKPFTL